MKRSINLGIPIPEVGGDIDTWGNYLIECLEVLDEYGGEIIEARKPFPRLIDKFLNIEVNINSISNSLNIASQIGDYNLLNTLYRILGYKKNCINEYLAGSSLRYENGVVTLTGPVIFNIFSGENLYLYKIPQNVSYSVAGADNKIVNLVVSGSPSNPKIELQTEDLTDDFITESETPGTIRIGFIIGTTLYKIPANRQVIFEKTDLIDVSGGNLFNQWPHDHSLGFRPTIVDILVKVRSTDNSKDVWIRPSSDIMVPEITKHRIAFSIFPKGTTPYVYYDGSLYYDKIIQGVIRIE